MQLAYIPRGVNQGETNSCEILLVRENFALFIPQLFALMAPALLHAAQE
jgi:hypothetical protein